MTTQVQYGSRLCFVLFIRSSLSLLGASCENRCTVLTITSFLEPLYDSHGKANALKLTEPQFLHLGEALAIIVGLKIGLGRTVSLLREDRLSRASQVSFSSSVNGKVPKTLKAAFAGQLLFIATAWLAKCSTIWLMMRLFNLNGPKSQKNGKSKLYYTVCLALMALISLWGVGSMITLGIDCSVSNYIRAPPFAQCSGQVCIPSSRYPRSC